MNVEETFKNVVGRPMSPDEVTRYLKLQKEFEIPDTDAIWMMFIWFEFYQRIFEQFPEKARVEAVEVAQSLRAASVEVTKATSAEVKTSRELASREIAKMQEDAKRHIAAATGGILKDEIEKAVNQLKSQSNRPLHRNWLIALGVAVLVAVGGGAWGWTKVVNYYENVGGDAQKHEDKSILEKWERWSGVTSCQGPHWEMRTKEGSRLCLSGEAEKGWISKN